MEAARAVDSVAIALSGDGAGYQSVLRFDGSIMARGGQKEPE